ncbi:MAG: succinyldiaminopimelate transaminase [Gammaproteobacteria bacterium]|nr:succinyldiaminopimelate transaminase [Gammaproteobacteria bacterium]MCW8972285.1 succinyldiaminopimelate transaminase [Gammaproteobacteria bacterium]MCW8991880.1 succinyldiaminopimelate transaminase [Gammaproteobacteria bacterium]
MNPDLDKLQPYPFEKLNALKAAVTPAEKPHIALSIGEPKHQPPGFVIEELITHLHSLASYPLTKGRPELRQAISGWLTRRFALPEGSVDAEKHVLPVAGTREALFAFAQAVVDRTTEPLVLSPNPFYQIYEGAALLAGAEPWFLNTTAETGFLPDLDGVPAEVWQRCQLIYLCTPGNPTGAVADIGYLQKLIRLADEHEFIIASDECYSELYFDEADPPAGLLQAAAQMGRGDYQRCVVFHSLSKRSNLPGLRSGFVAGDTAVLERFLTYRTYQGCALPPPTQAASIAAWNDEAHVRANRELYRQKFDAVLAILQPVMKVERPDAGFYLWPETPISDTEFAQQLFAEQNVTVLPGSYLSRDAHGTNPGENRVRMALVAELDECIEAAERIRDFIETI